MGSYISVGFVYNNSSKEKISNELKNLISYLNGYSGYIKSFKISKDKDGNEWLEYNSSNEIQMNDFYSFLSIYHYGEFEVICNLLGQIDLIITVHIKKEHGDYFGFLLDISENKIIKSNTQSELKNVTEKIIDFMEGYYNNSKFDYSFCDNEGEILYSPEDFNSQENEIYSVVVKPSLDKNKKNLTIFHE